MSENTYWGTVPGPTEFEFIEPGDYTDNRCTENDGHAVWMGESLVEGSLDEWEQFARALIEKIDASRITPTEINDLPTDLYAEVANGRMTWEEAARRERNAPATEAAHRYYTQNGTCACGKLPLNSSIHDHDSHVRRAIVHG